jgi:hypothetical protein
LKYEKMLIEKQIEELYKKKLPKELLELMSYREKALVTQVEELRQRLEESKTDREAHL